MNANRGYFGIGIYHPKTDTNVGTLWRSAHNLGAAFIFTIGKRYSQQASDTTKASRHVPLYEYSSFDDFLKDRPIDCPLISIEQAPESIPLETFIHPERAIYILGAEDAGLPENIMKKSQAVLSIDSPMCLNVAVAGSIVMYDRRVKQRPQ